MHYDSELELGKYTMAFGGRTRNNEALKIAAAALKEEGFGRLGLGVAKGEVFEGSQKKKNLVFRFHKFSFLLKECLFRVFVAFRTRECKSFGYAIDYPKVLLICCANQSWKRLAAILLETRERARCLTQQRDFEKSNKLSCFIDFFFFILHLFTYFFVRFTVSRAEGSVRWSRRDFWRLLCESPTLLWTLL